ncbi:sigma-70 family RNA polymerase sigma factor [Verrucomicrobium sp. BvORR106]|uniref:RNA polymerase sigma factor n=1 Tax=Verrucomicrobium sp. BvORR106 TaxID=1403819 RepID=UPI0006924EFA|nr:sigma-70 family RNA polymerase sigma factor [Verrucomicrobium sp. BvORR106]
MEPTQHAAFPVTQWTEVVRACQQEDGTRRQRAVASLCGEYWYPLYAFARRTGRSQHDAEDLTQGFFCHVLERNLVANADRELGRLRTFLLSIFKRYMSDVDDKARALKRGGGQPAVSLDAQDAEQRYLCEPADAETPETLYQRAWALAVLQSAVESLRSTEHAGGNGRQFEILVPHLSPDSEAAGSGYEGAAEALKTSVENVRQLVSRLRKKYRTCLRQQIAATLHEPGEEQIDLEVAALKAALRR